MTSTQKSLFETVWATSKKINDGRSKIDVLAKSMEELGELSVEVMIDQYVSNKQPGKDGVIGEAIDVMICMADMIFQIHDDVPLEVLQQILENKLAKWEQSAKS